MSISQASLEEFIGLVATGPEAVPNVNLAARGAELIKKHPHIMETLEEVLAPVAMELSITREALRHVAERLIPRLVQITGKVVAQAAAQKGDTTGMGLPQR